MARNRPNYSERSRREAWEFLRDTGQPVKPFETYKTANRSLVERASREIGRELGRKVGSKSLPEAAKEATSTPEPLITPLWREEPGKVYIDWNITKVYRTFAIGQTDGVDRLGQFPTLLALLLAEEGRKFQRGQLVLHGISYASSNQFSDDETYVSSPIYTIATLPKGLRDISEKMVMADELVVHLRRVENVR